jgi:hypothetical protein
MARTYGWNRFNELWQVNPPPAGNGVFIQALGPPDGDESTLIRTILRAQLTAEVTTNGSHPPPTYGWLRTNVIFNATFVDANLTPLFIADPNDPGSAEMQVCVATTTPELTLSPTATNKYYVKWRQEFLADSHAQRVNTYDVGAVAAVNFGMWVDSVDAWFRHTTPFDIVWSSWLFGETLWLTRA